MMCQILSLSNEGLDIPVLLDLKEHFELFQNVIQSKTDSGNFPFHTPIALPSHLKSLLLIHRCQELEVLGRADTILKYRCL